MHNIFKLLFLSIQTLKALKGVRLLNDAVIRLGKTKSKSKSIKNREWSSHVELRPGLFCSIQFVQAWNFTLIITILSTKPKISRKFGNLSVLILAQLCGVMPLIGISAKSPKQLKFTWFNLRMLHSAIIMSALLAHAYFSLRWAAYNKVNVSVLGKYFLLSNFHFQVQENFLSFCFVQNRSCGSHQSWRYPRIPFGWQCNGPV